MRVAGIVAEYNPFHNGHLYHIEKTREAGATHIVAVMSGNFVQRGEPALMDKRVRAEAAACSGVDLVLELPVPYALSSAERFAFGAVDILNSLGCVDMLSFGAETPDAKRLDRAASILLGSDFPAALKDSCADRTLSFAAARERAFQALGGSDELSSPNNILAVEYLKACRLLSAHFVPLAVPRTGAAHDREPSGDTACAKWIRENLDKELSAFMPDVSFALFGSERSAGQLSGGLASLEKALLARFRSAKPSDGDVLADAGDGLFNRMLDAAKRAGDMEEFFELSKTKSYALSRIKRVALNFLIDIPAALALAPPPYIRVLAVGKGGRELLNAAGRRAKKPIASSLARLAKTDERCAACAGAEERAGNIYALTLEARRAGDEYTRKIFIAPDEAEEKA